MVIQAKDKVILKDKAAIQAKVVFPVHREVKEDILDNKEVIQDNNHNQVMGLREDTHQQVDMHRQEEVMFRHQQAFQVFHQRHNDCLVWLIGIALEKSVLMSWKQLWSMEKGRIFQM